MIEPPAATVTAVLTGVVDRVLLHKVESGYTVLRLQTPGGDRPVVVGTMVEPDRGELVRVEGAWYEDRIWGRQFRANAVQIEPPASEDALIAYLGSGRIKGLGEVVARRLVAEFGRELGAVIEREPERLRAIAGVGPKLIGRLRAAWVGQRQHRDLLVLLAGSGIGGGRAARILDTWGADARAVLTADPYALSREIRGIGFKTADALAQKLGVPPHSPLRLGAAIGELLRDAAGDGHIGLTRGEALARLQALLACGEAEADAALAHELTAGRLRARQGDAGEVVMLAELDAAEALVADHLTKLAAGAPAWGEIELAAAVARAEAALGFALAASQREAIGEAVRRRLLVVTGGPGTGKTTLVRGILAALGDAARDPILAAPTGRAARHLAESTGRDARTLHRLLEADPDRGFRRNALRPLEGDLVIVDEASMVDTRLLAALLEALPAAASLVLVGDVDQLPSIGPGQVLADVIASSTAPVLRLTEIFRQAAESGIVRNAHRINRGELPLFDKAEEGERDFFGIRVEGAEDAAAKLLELVAARIPERFGLDPLTELQVLTPVHRGDAGTRALNDALQARLNPAPAAVLPRHDHSLATGDRVMQLENDYEREVYNGDAGRLAAIDPVARVVAVEIDGRLVTYAEDDLNKLGLAYAITVHKAQGSEYPAIVLPLLREHGRMLRRDLLYTAITRARRLVVLLVEPEALERAVRTTGAGTRLTLLRRRLAGLEV